MYDIRDDINRVVHRIGPPDKGKDLLLFGCQRKKFVEFVEHGGLFLVQVSVHLHDEVGTVITAGEIAVDFVQAGDEESDFGNDLFIRHEYESAGVD
jgi:hypothetical protein